MKENRFFQAYTRPAMHFVPCTEGVSAESKDAAIQELVKIRNLVFESCDGENVWMVHRADGSVHKYCVIGGTSLWKLSL